MNKKITHKRLSKFNKMLAKVDIGAFAPVYIESDCNEFFMITGKVNPVNCDSDLMTFISDSFILEINGTDLTLDTYTESGAFISGKIDKIEFVNGEKNE